MLVRKLLGVVGLSMVSAGCLSFRWTGQVESGFVSGGIRSLNHYRIVSITSSSVVEDRSCIDWGLPHYSLPDTIKDLQAVFPEIFTDGDDAIPIEVEVKVISADSGGAWTAVLFGCSLGIIPGYIEQTASAEVCVRFHGEDVVIGRETFGYRSDSKSSFFSPFGLIPYSDPPDAQSCRCTAGVMIPDVGMKPADVLSETLISSVVSVLEKYEKCGKREICRGPRPRVVKVFRPGAVGPDGLTDAQRETQRAQALATAAREINGIAMQVNSDISSQAAQRQAMTQADLISRRETAAANQRNRELVGAIREQARATSAAASTSSVGAAQKPSLVVKRRCSSCGTSFTGLHCPRCMAPDFGNRTYRWYPE